MSRSRYLLLALLAAALSLFFVDLGGSAIWDANEAFYVETPREMIERGDYIFPTFNYEPRVNKPVLSYWIVAGFYKLFGVSVAVQRIPIAIGGVLIVLIAFFLGRLAFAGDRDSATMAGLWAAMGLAVSARLLMFSRRIFIDIYITLFMAATLLFFALAERYPERRRLFLALMYVAVGLGVLTKGPVAIALPGLVFLIYLLVHRELRRATQMMIPAGILIVSAIVVPWYAALYQRDGWTHILSFFIGENLGRFSEGIGVDQDRGPLFYIGVLFGDGFPWSILLFAAAAAFFRYSSSARKSTPHPAPSTSHPAPSTPHPAPSTPHPAPSTPHPAPSTPHVARRTSHVARLQALLWIWIATIVIFFSFSASKQDLYIYPVMPAVAALGGIAIAAAWPGVRWSSAAIGALFAIIGAGLLWVFQATGNVYELEGVPTVAVLAIAGGLALTVLAAKDRWRQGLLVFLAACVLINWMLVLRVVPSFEKYKPVPPITRFLESRVTPDDVVAHYSVALPSMVYYMRRHIDVTYDREAFIRIMQQPKRVFGVLWTQEYERLRDDLGVPTCPIFQTSSFNIKLGAVIKREKLPQLVVITNSCE